MQPPGVSAADIPPDVPDVGNPVNASTPRNKNPVTSTMPDFSVPPPTIPHQSRNNTVPRSVQYQHPRPPITVIPTSDPPIFPPPRHSSTRMAPTTVTAMHPPPLMATQVTGQQTQYNGTQPATIPSFIAPQKAQPPAYAPYGTSKPPPMVIGQKWKPDLTAAPIMAPLEYQGPEEEQAQKSGGGDQTPYIHKGPQQYPTVVIPPRALDNLNQPVYLVVNPHPQQITGQLPYAAKYFDPTKLQPYMGKSDTRSPIAFVREFENCTSGIPDDITRGQLFIRAFNLHHFQAAKSYRYDAGFKALKELFLKTEWNENCKQQILYEIDNSEYDPRKFDSIADYIIDMYSKMFDCQLTIQSIHSRIISKAPFYYNGNLREKHCATFQQFSEKVRSLHAIFGKYDASMQLPSGKPVKKNEATFYMDPPLDSPYEEEYEHSGSD
ncbi:hypothetical protein ACFE04_020612 [Oxalis oulophora]